MRRIRLTIKDGIACDAKELQADVRKMAPESEARRAGDDVGFRERASSLFAVSRPAFIQDTNK